ncbi:PP2C family protein-serine/threonine phosphatase [Kineococcus auxinigenes]|uniref:PP2C family protein-serine/threonine phosphatase n=1 Tax=unclassified Kineococcus TaxID=2621656 RepID=UPI003D7D6C7A
MLRTTLQRRVSVMAGVFLLISLALTVVLAQSMWTTEGDGQIRSAAQQERAAVAESLDGFREAFVKLHVVHQQYVLSADPTQTPSLLRERSDLAEDLTTRQRTLLNRADELGDTEVTAGVEALLDDVRAWRIAAREQARVKATGDAQGLRNALADAPASRQFRSAYVRVEELTDELQDQRFAAGREAEEDVDRFQLVQVAVLAVALLMVPTVLHLVRRWVLRPLDLLSQQMLRVGGGDLQTPVGLAGPPELTAVAHSAETMRRRILDELADAVSAREALSQGQPLVAEVRDQLAAHELPTVAGWSSAAALRPAEGLLAGDWYDVLHLEDGRYAVVVADVSGHGARAGIVAIQLKRLLEAALHLAPEPDLALAMAARVFTDEAERFASCVVAVVDPDSGLVRYANAGHPAPLVLRSDGGAVRVVAELGATGPLLSWLHLDVPGAWTTGTASLAPGSMLVVYTDGLTEARPSGTTDELGVEGVLAALSRLPELTPQALVDEALEVARRHSGGRARDDVTLVALARSTSSVPAAPSTARPAGAEPAAQPTAQSAPTGGRGRPTG